MNKYVLFTTEEASIQYMVSWLAKKGHKNLTPTQDMDKFCSYDISFTSGVNNESCIIEVKRFPNRLTSWYSDCFIENKKYKALMRRVYVDKDVDEVFTCHLFPDGMVLNNITEEEPYMVKRLMCPKTTDFSNNELIIKTCCIWNFDSTHIIPYDYSLLSGISGIDYPEEIKKKWA